jgi:Carboxypeptidase regulatory-like domain
MKNYLPKFLFVFVILALCGLPVFGQVTTAGSIVGTVTDPTGAVIPNATITAKNKATGKESTATTSDSGNFNIPQVSPGLFTITVQATSGFKKAQITDVKVDVGTPATVNVVLELGNPTETVTIVGGGEVIQTQSATIGTTLTGRQITDIPTASRDALDLVLALPGTTTVGRPRQSSVNGLPKGALNISIDGINVQDNYLKSNDGFFTYIRPRTDAISEVTVSTSNPGAESSGEGAFQIKFVTQGGGNQYHGGGYWYYRSPGLNANYWFNNRDLTPDPITHRAPRTDIILNQPGFKIGGPISIPKLFNGKDKAFFFFNYEEYRLPESTLRTRNLMSTAAQAGSYQFFSSSFVVPTTGFGAGATTCTGSGTSRLCSVNVYQVIGNAAIAGALTNADPTVSSLLAAIRTAAPGPRTSGDPNVDQTTFINKGGQKREFPTVRFDFNLTKKHHIENIWNYQNFGGVVDFLNSVDPAFPGFPNHGAQTSIRFSDSMAWRWTISNNMVNEARYGIVGGTTLFFGEVGASQFANQGGYALSLSNFSSGGFGLQNATVTTGPQRRNSPVREFSDSLSWIHRNHSFSFGATATRIAFWQQLQTVVPTVSFAVSSTLDPLPFSAFSFLGNSTLQTGAAQLYNVLSGRLNAITGVSRLSETNNQYTYLGPLISRDHSLEWGAFGQDSWRFRPNITLTFGLRYERQQPIVADNSTYASVSYADLFGESGVGNLFQPGTLTGQHSAFTLLAPGTPAYKATGIFLPSVGFTYSPNWKSHLLHPFLGESGQTVFRGGFSMASVREGSGVFQGVVGANPGGALTAARNITVGNLPVGTYLRSGPAAAPPSCTSVGIPVGCVPASPTYPNNGLITDSVNGFDPNLKIGYVESWSFGVQREFKKDNVFEVRYVGNRGHKLWRQIDLNELNIVENGVFSEWKLAQQNLLANINNGQGTTFKYRGPGTGTFPLPITLAYFSGLANNTPGGDPSNTNNYTSTNFGSATYFNTMNPLNPSPIGFGSLLASTSFDSRRTPAGQACFGLTGCTGLGLFPYNMFYVNPGKQGGPFLVNNSAESWYDAVTFEFRRRFSRGLLVQSSYTFGKSLSNTFASSSSVFDQPATLRNNWLKKGVAPFDIRHGFKTNFIYELPFGQGKTFLSSSHGLVERLVGGWGFNGNVRIQSGIPFAFNAPLTIGPGIQNTGNFQLVGMTFKDLQKAVGIYKDGVTATGAPDGFVYLLPKDIRDNSVKAFNIAMTATGAAYTLGAPTGRFIAPAGFNNCAQAYIGQCGFANLVLHGPRFSRFDLAMAKKIKFTESVNLELRMEFLNAFNNIDFQPGAAANDINTLAGVNSTSLSNSFSRITAAYQDLSTTNDPGGRVGQIVVRLNF